jgi:hypothetical protein
MGIVTLNVDDAVFQRRVSTACAAGTAITSIAATGLPTCGPLGTGDITDVLTPVGSGLTGGGSAGSISLSADTMFLQRRISLPCPVGAVVSAVNADGTLVCVMPGDITDVSGRPGSGIIGGAATGAALLDTDFTILQRRVSGTCPAGQYVQLITQAGGVMCGMDANTVYTAGAGLQLTGTTFAIAPDGVTAAHLAVDSVGSDELDMENGARFVLATAVAGANYAMAPPFTPASSGLCLVTATAAVTKAGSDVYGNTFVRTARQVGAMAPVDDGLTGLYAVSAMGQNYTSAVTMQQVWSVTGGVPHQFGCYVNTNGDLIGDSIYCRVSWICF